MPSPTWRLLRRLARGFLYLDRLLGELCRELGLPFDPGYQQRWQAYDKVTGDSAGPSRSFAQSHIAALPPRPIDETILAALRRDPGYAECLALLGYEDLGP